MTAVVLVRWRCQCVTVSGGDDDNDDEEEGRDVDDDGDGADVHNGAAMTTRRSIVVCPVVTRLVARLVVIVGLFPVQFLQSQVWARQLGIHGQ